MNFISGCNHVNRWWFQPILKNISQIGSFPQGGMKQISGRVLTSVRVKNSTVTIRLVHFTYLWDINNLIDLIWRDLIHLREVPAWHPSGYENNICPKAIPHHLFPVSSTKLWGDSVNTRPRLSLVLMARLFNGFHQDIQGLQMIAGYKETPPVMNRLITPLMGVK